MTRSVMMNFESGYLEPKRTDGSVQNNAPAVSRSLPDLCSYSENLEEQVATLDVTSEEIHVPPKTYSSRLSLRSKDRRTSGEFSESSEASKCYKQSPENNHSISPSQSVSSSASKLCNVSSLENLRIDPNGLQPTSSDSTSLKADVSREDPDGNLTSSTNSFSEERLEFTDINLNNSEDDTSDSPRSIPETPPSLPEKRNGVMDSILGWISPANTPVSSKQSSQINMPTNSHCNAPTSPTNLSKMSFFKNKTYYFWNKPVEPLSTTALILEDRPRNLPKKPVNESEKHRQEYEKMVEMARKNEIRDGQLRRKKMKEQLKQEECIASVGFQWQNEILPNWTLLHQTHRVRQLWWNGLPPNVRGKIWQLAIGNDLNLTHDLYDIMVSRAHEKLRIMHEGGGSGAEDSESLTADREDTVELIRLDISRTFPKLCIFQKGGPYYDVLHDTLGAYVCYRPDVGYVQGMSFIAAMLLLNMEPSQVFLTFANMLNRPCQIAFFRLNEEMMKAYFAAFEVFFEENLPRLFAHFKQSNLTPDMYLIDWIFTMFSKSLNLDTASRVWDVFCRDGEEFLFKTAIGILKLHRDALLQMEFIHAAQFLTKLPADVTDGEKLFRNIADLTMLSRGNRRWKDVLSLLQQNKDDSSPT